MDNLTQAEVEALRALAEWWTFSEYDKLSKVFVYDVLVARCHELERGGYIDGCYRSDLGKGAYHCWKLTDKGRAVVERLGAE